MNRHIFYNLKLEPAIKFYIFMKHIDMIHLYYNLKLTTFNFISFYFYESEHQVYKILAFL